MIHPYEFVEKPESDFYSIKLTDGPYDGVIYTYGEVQLVEDKDNDELKVKFKYKLENIPKKLKENKLKKLLILSFFAAFIPFFLSSCGTGADARKYPPDPKLRVKKNM